MFKDVYGFQFYPDSQALTGIGHVLVEERKSFDGAL